MALVVTTFKIKALRKFLRDNNVTLQVLANKNLNTDDRILALLVKLNVNIDFAMSPTTTPRRLSRSERVRRSVDRRGLTFVACLVV